MAKNTIIFCAAILSLAVSISAQPPDSLWSRTFGGDDSDRCFSVQQTSDGGYILVGETRTFGAGSVDCWMVKTNENGDSLWSRTFGGNYEDECYSVQQTSDGRYILAGFTKSFGAGCANFWLIKTDENGDSLWSRTFGGNDWDDCYSVLQTSDSGYILAGYTYSYGAGCSDFWLIKTDESGDSLWSKTFGGYDDDCCWSVQQTSDGGYMLAGQTKSFGAGGTDFWMVKTDENGDSLWSHSFGWNNFDKCFSVKQTSDGGYILAGYAQLSGTYNSDFWLIKTDEDGDSLWSRTFGGDDLEECYSIQQTSDGGYILAGYTHSFGAGGDDFWLIKVGAEVEVEGFPSSSIPKAFSLSPAYPNPFNSMTTISFELQAASFVTLMVYDVMGREVARIVNGWRYSGAHNVSFDGSELSSGIYFARLTADNFHQTQKLLLIM